MRTVLAVAVDAAKDNAESKTIIPIEERILIFAYMRRAVVGQCVAYIHSQ